jgi:hypothetical protein
MSFQIRLAMIAIAALCPIHVVGFGGPHRTASEQDSEVRHRDMP